jgi:hypothetical protein
MAAIDFIELFVDPRFLHVAKLHHNSSNLQFAEPVSMLKRPALRRSGRPIRQENHAGTVPKN